MLPTDIDETAARIAREKIPCLALILFAFLLNILAKATTISS